MKTTIAQRLERCSNRPSGFDYLRLALASAVLASHTINVVYGYDVTSRVIWHSPLRPFFAVILPMFFALSGFLVASSLERSRTLVSFMGLRFLRLVPALGFDTLVAALLIGPLFTALPPAEYFAHPAFRAYFLNIVGDVHFVLPGVFDGNPTPSSVNGQLWTLPYELYCYAGLGALALLGLARSRRVFLAAVALLWLFLTFRVVSRNLGGTAELVTVTPTVLVICFLLGVAIYFFRDRIVLARSWFAVSLAIGLALLLNPFGDFLAAPFLVYATVYLGLLNPARWRLVASGDYSYGIFLYGFPVQQSLISALPWLPWYAHLPLSYLITFALAAFSWHAIEAPALKLRPLLYRFEAAILRWSGAIPFGSYVVAPPVSATMRRPPARETS